MDIKSNKFYINSSKLRNRYKFKLENPGNTYSEYLVVNINPNKAEILNHLKIEPSYRPEEIILIRHISQKRNCYLTKDYPYCIVMFDTKLGKLLYE